MANFAGLAGVEEEVLDQNSITTKIRDAKKK